MGSDIGNLMSKIATYYSDACGRAKRRKSPWNFLLLPGGVIGILGSFFFMSQGLLSIQHHLIPADALLSNPLPVGGFLMLVLPIFPSFPLGLLFANLMAWCI